MSVFTALVGLSLGPFLVPLMLVLAFGVVAALVGFCAVALDLLGV